MGVWIEILQSTPPLIPGTLSLPAWECGLKFRLFLHIPKALFVTPCVGVWIEINIIPLDYRFLSVTPCVGVWIEIVVRIVYRYLGSVSLPAWECGLKSLAIVTWID